MKLTQKDQNHCKDTLNWAWLI